MQLEEEGEQAGKRRLEECELVWFVSSLRGLVDFQWGVLYCKYKVCSITQIFFFTFVIYS